jgi:DNA polymerase-3 subunit alpha
MLNKRALEALIYSGALDGFKIDRAILINTYPSAVRQAEQRQNDHDQSVTHRMFFIYLCA